MVMNSRKKNSVKMNSKMMNTKMTMKEEKLILFMTDIPKFKIGGKMFEKRRPEKGFQKENKQGCQQ